MTFAVVGVHYDPRCKLKKKTDHQRLGPTAYLVDRKQVHGPGVCSQKWRFILNYSPHKWASRWVRCMFKQQITPTPGIEGITHLLSWLKIISFQLAKLPQTSSYANKWDPVKILPLNQDPLKVKLCSTGWGWFVLFNFSLYPKHACSRVKRCRERQGNLHFFIDDVSSYSFPSPTGFPRADPSPCVSLWCCVSLDDTASPTEQLWLSVTLTQRVRAPISYNKASGKRTDDLVKETQTQQPRFLWTHPYSTAHRLRAQALGLNFLFCKMGITVVVPTSQVSG